MTKNIKLTKKKMFVLLFSIAFFGTLLMFQNCSKQKFKADYTSTSIGADTQYYVNKKDITVNVKIDSPFADRFDLMRASLNSDMKEADGSEVAWLPFADKIGVDLGNEFNQDGSKDGAKVVYLEVKESGYDHLVIPITQNIFLDTQPPVINTSGILDDGLQNQTFAKGQNVDLDVNIEDPLSLSGVSSGFDSTAFSWGVSEDEDCSADTNTSQWMAAPAGKFGVSWPEADPLKAFYFCMYAKDKAQNVTPYKSEPMSSLWYVYVGDNNEGNGGSVTSAKVRFKKPTYLTLDLDRNILVSDIDFGTWRRISSGDSRTIESFSPTPNFPIYPTSPIVYDSFGNAYFVAGTDIYIQPKNTILPIKIAQTFGPTYLAIRKYQNTYRLLVYSFDGNAAYYVADDARSKSFLYEIPLATWIKSNGQILVPNGPVVTSANLANYKIAGNGTMANTAFTVPDDVVLSKNDPVDTLHSLSIPYSITTSDIGEIFISTRVDGGARGFGMDSIRRLTQQADGTFKQKIIHRPTSSNYTWYGQMAFHKQLLKNGTTLKILAAGGAYQPLLINLNTLEVTHPFAGFPLLGGLGVAIVPHADGLDYDYYFTTNTDSKIYHYASDFTLTEKLGRDVHDYITKPVASIIGNPDGLMQEPNGDFFFVDSQNAVINKVSKAGVLSKVAGEVQNVTAPNYYNHLSIEDYTLGCKYYRSSHRYLLSGDFNPALNRRTLYVLPESGNVDAIDLVRKDVTSLMTPWNSSQPAEDHKYFWTNSAAAFVKGANDQNTILFTKRFNEGSGFPGYGSWQTTFVSFVAQMPVRNNVLLAKQSSYMGDVLNNDMTQNGDLIDKPTVAMNAANQSIKVDSQKYVYVSGPQFKISKMDALSKAHVLDFPMNSFVVIDKDVNTKLIIYTTTSGKNLYGTEMDSRKFFTVDNPVTMLPKKLCLPGTTVGQVNDIIFDDDGNLVISDTQKGRILKYRIRMQDGTLKMNYCP